MTQDYYPPPAFYFTVTVIGSGAALALLTGIDASFKEVSGIRAEFGTEEVTEGGENRFVHRLPQAAKYANLVMKRGVVTKDSFLAEWVGQTIGSTLSLPIIPQNLLVSLLNEDGFPAIAWAFVNAWPVRWEVDPLNSMNNDILVETLEFSYNYFERFNLGGPGAMAVKLAQFSAKLASL
ncbi:MAG TPA: phage tail protein [Candidatus Angelobacter sp.]